MEGGYSVDLGAALEGHREIYRQAGGSAALEVVWWEWPVESQAGALRQRVIVERTAPPGVTGGGGDQVIEFARELVAAEAHGSANGSVP